MTGSAREFVVEADGGSRGNPGPAGYGAVVLDAATGETLVEAAEYLGVVTNNVAEYRGLLAGLRAARELDPDATVHVRMDSKLVVEQMSGRWKIKHPDMKPLATEAARVFPPGRVTYEWIPRAHNKHADRLANEAMDAGARGEQWSPSASTADLDTGGTADRAARAGEAGAGVRDGAGARAVVGGDARGAAGGRAAGGRRSGDESAAGERLAQAARTGAETVAPSAVARPSAAGSTAGTPSADSTAGTSATGGAAGTSATGGAAGTSVSGSTAGTSAAADADVRAAKAVASPGWGPPDMGAPATFVLLRHGETPLTPQKRFSGSGGSDPSLSPVGREQAEKVAESLARRGTIEAVVASPLARTRETAGVVAARLGLQVTVEEGLRETDFGAWEGLTFGEVRERYPADLDAWLASPDAEPTGGGESFAATGARIAATRDKLVAAYAGRTVLLVSHVTPIKTFLRLALGAPPESLFRMELSAASLSAVAYYADGGASVRLFNETSHLR
ncbi:bifunctional RNase H/acid phosphatase [Streptomyces sp. M1013]|uniref:bifunctional RNase H/acid phosphatase n=1 Tax=Streptomyces sp. M1013 TaxID=549798 RepID=UPI000978F7AB|nr:bifunctional RNase H/acid phosphatase [Streptomyces sp. M1013]OMI89558.1 bifunctional RNase H/acid phosphatase [Streptomyces sp. M1013]